MLPERPKPQGGRPRCDDRAAPTGIIFVLRSGIPWEMLLRELGCSGMTCWRRLRVRHEAGVWAGLHRVLLKRLANAEHMDWSLASLDSASGATKGGAETGPNPTTRGEPGAKRHLVVDCRGTPLGVCLSSAKRHDSLILAATPNAVPGVRHGRGRPRRRPRKLHADKVYDYRRCRRDCRARSIQPRIVWRGVETSNRPGQHPWVVERTFAWRNRFRRLAIPYERRADIYEALVTLGCALICLNQIRSFC